MKQGTQSQCSGTTQRDGVGEGGGRGVRTEGTDVHPRLIHVDVWQNPQYCKVIILQLKQLIKKNKAKFVGYGEKRCIYAIVKTTEFFDSVLMPIFYALPKFLQ